MATKNTKTTNTPERATDAYLASLGMDLASVPRSTADPVVSISHAPKDPMAWTGQTFEALSGDYEFYRASKFNRGHSIEQAEREGYRRLPDGHDARMIDCSDDNDVIMIRDRQLGEAKRAEAEAIRRTLNETNSHGVQTQGTRAPVGVHIHD